MSDTLFKQMTKDIFNNAEVNLGMNDELKEGITTYLSYNYDFFMAKVDDAYGGNEIINDDYEKYPQFFYDYHPHIKQWTDKQHENGAFALSSNFTHFVAQFFGDMRPDTATYDDVKAVIEDNDRQNPYYNDISEVVVGYLMSVLAEAYAKQLLKEEDM